VVSSNIVLYDDFPEFSRKLTGILLESVYSKGCGELKEWI
jgi:hypothetical protein